MQRGTHSMLNNSLKTYEITKILESAADLKLIQAILNQYTNIASVFYIGKYEEVLVKAGKFAELVYQMLDYIIRGRNANSPDFNRIDKRLEEATSKELIDPSFRSLVTPSLRLIYKFRNSRDGAHISDIVANRIDAQMVLQLVKWIIAEMIRIYSNLEITKCMELVEDILRVDTPVIFKKNNIQLVLRDFSAYNQILAHLYYSVNHSMEEKKLKEIMKHSPNISVQNTTTSLKNSIMRKHVIRQNGMCTITPLGIEHIVKVIRKEE